MKKLLELSDVVRAALSEGKRLSFADLEDLNFVLDMMVRGLVSRNRAILLTRRPPQNPTLQGKE